MFYVIEIQLKANIKTCLNFSVNDNDPANIYLFKVKKKHWEKVWNMIKVNNKDIRTTLIGLVLVS